jgi:hypothetical protein
MTITLFPSKDSIVAASPSLADSTYGSVDMLEVGYDFSNTPPWGIFSILKFDIKMLPENAIIEKARFRFYMLQPIEYSEKTPEYKITRAKSDWEENTVKWSNKPEMDTASSTATFDNTIGYKEWDVTNLVKSWIDGTYPNYGFYVAPVLRTDWNSRFYSREGNSKPQLAIDYTTPEENIIIIPDVPQIDIPLPLPDTPPLIIPDVFPPTISNIKISNAGVTKAKVTWTTDEESTSYVVYGDTAEYTNHSGQADSVKTHEVIIENLIPLKTYHYSVQSKDKKGNQAKTADAKFTQSFSVLPLPSSTEPATEPATEPNPAQQPVPDSEIETSYGVGYEANTLLEKNIETTKQAASTKNTGLENLNQNILYGVIGGAAAALALISAIAGIVLIVTKNKHVKPVEKTPEQEVHVN